MKSKLSFSFLLLVTNLLFFTCKTEPTGPQPISATEVESSLQKILIEAKSGEMILLPEGTFSFKRALSFNDIPNVTIKGMGKGKTILSFKNQIEGAEGMILKNAKNLKLEGFTVQDSKGDAIKVQACENVTFRDLETTWTNGASPENGGYGIYPVSCTNVLIEKCEASYAMDAGIYVGQTTNAVVRDNYVHHNVAGLEIENTRNAEVYKNTAKQNAAGMLIFDMPDLPQANGYKVKFYDNHMEDNNGENFSKPGIVVNTLPSGTGMLIMAHKDIEVYNNTIKNHKSMGIGINSWIFTGQPFESKEFDPFCSNINIHDNVITETNGPAIPTTDFGKLLYAICGEESPDIIIVGIFNPATLDKNGKPTGFCFKNNGDITFRNMNAAMGATPEDIVKNMNDDISIFDCEMPSFELGDFDKWLAKK
ncbi:MAG: parallel beta-helix domain-containing protein [Saprospiraceae bacterium]